jgi:hypothetical protein
MTASWTSYETATSPFCYLTNLLNNDQIWYDIWTNVAWRKEEIQRIYDLFKQYSQEPTITMSGITKYNTHNQPHHLTITSTQVDQCLAHFLKTPSALDDRNINSLTISFFNTHTINCLQVSYSKFSHLYFFLFVITRLLNHTVSYFFLPYYFNLPKRRLSLVVLSK